MNARIIGFAVATAVALLSPDAHALGKKEKGCLVGGAAGGIGGKVLADHALIGAAAGCAVGTIVADKRDQKQQAAKRREEQDRVARRRHHSGEVVRNDQRVTY